MAKAKRKTSSSPVSRSRKLIDWADRHRLKSVLIVAAIALVGWLIVSAINNHIKTAHERAQFAQTKTDFDELYRRIASVTGVPAQHKAVQSCEYTNSEWSSGFLYCNLDQYLIYSAGDNIQNQINMILKNDAGIVEDLRAVTDDNFRETHSYQHLASYSFSSRYQRKCSIAYWKINGELPYQSYGFNPPLKNGLFVNINCSSPALKAYYPLSTTKTGAPIY